MKKEAAWSRLKVIRSSAATAVPGYAVFTPVVRLRWGIDFIFFSTFFTTNFFRVNSKNGGCWRTNCWRGHVAVSRFRSAHIFHAHILIPMYTRYICIFLVYNARASCIASMLVRGCEKWWEVSHRRGAMDAQTWKVSWLHPARIVVEPCEIPENKLR